MSDVAIRVEGLSKLYRIGPRERYKALRDTVTDALYAPFRAVRSALNGGPLSVNGREDTIWALKDVSFEIKQGEVVGIIGRNGAGKSTLLKILSRITEPTEGHAEIHGRVGSLLEVGTGFHPELTGRENIFLNGAILGMKKAEIGRKFDGIVAFAEVEKFIDTPVKHYSSGMYVRLAFAVAAHLEPEILLVDEVLAVGDAAFQKKCLGKMGDVAKEGRTILFVSHNMAAIRRLCKSAMVLENGLMKFLGPTGQAIESYSGLVGTVHEVTFVPRHNQPSITQVRVDPLSLAEGCLQVEIDFESPYPLNPPVPGIVLYSVSGVPVFGSNPRFHKDGFNPCSIDRGLVKFVAKKIPICSGRYSLSVWLGDWYSNYDHRPDILAFEFKSGQVPSNAPSPDLIGYVDTSAAWRVMHAADPAGAENESR